MEYVVGEDLEKRINRKGILPEAEALRYIQQIGEALSFIHTDKGLLHRDVKPNNIILRKSNQEAVLIDFGIARGFIPDMTQQMTPFHTPAFAPPEQILENGRYGEYTDVYALAATLYFLLTNAYPTSAPLRALDKPLKAPNQINFEISPDVEQAIFRGMAMEYQKRPQSVREWLNLLIPSEVDNLRSIKGVNYSKLRDLLKAGKWQEANEETNARMLEATDREEEGWLHKKHIVNFPCEDFRTIDQLWVKYSQGRFGFSVQAKIYFSVGGTDRYEAKSWRAFNKCVGWRKQGRVIAYSSLTFDTSAPYGHLPWPSGVNFLSRVKTCRI